MGGGWLAAARAKTCASRGGGRMLDSVIRITGRMRCRPGRIAARMAPAVPENGRAGPPR
jgi:hypothetical protein